MPTHMLFFWTGFGGSTDAALPDEVSALRKRGDVWTLKARGDVSTLRKRTDVFTLEEKR